MSKKIFVEFRLVGTKKRISVGVSKIIDFFESSGDRTSIFMGGEETFQVAHTYEEVTEILEKCRAIKIIKC